MNYKEGYKKILARPPQLIIQRSFIRTHLNYGDIIYDKACNASFHQSLDIIQFNLALATRGAMWGSSKRKLYQELRLESLCKKNDDIDTFEVRHNFL